MSARTITVTTPSGDVPLTVTESGASGRPVLLLHGGAGPDSVTGFGERARRAVPVPGAQPGLPGVLRHRAPRLARLHARTLAEVLGGLLEDLDLTDVIVPAARSAAGWRPNWRWPPRSESVGSC